jgi:Transglycosylase SLT domain
MYNELKMIEVASKLGVQRDWLYNLIKFESNLDPQIKNPYSSARGLIQVIDSTAQSVFSVPDSLSLIRKYPDFDSQMDNVVYPYLKQYMPYSTKQSLYMAVFFPYARYVEPGTTFESMYKKLYPSNWREKYSSFIKGNEGILTVQDYVNKVDGLRSTGAKKESKVSPIVLIVLGAIGLYYLIKTKKI